MGKRGRPPHPDILTPREWQVLDLLRRDFTNEQIAHRLDISPSTAKYHVSEILSKLAVETREEAAAWQPEAVAVNRWQRGLAWLPSRAWPLAGAAGALGALAVLGLLLVWTDGDRRESAAVAEPSTTAVAEPQPTADGHGEVRLNSVAQLLSTNPGSPQYQARPYQPPSNAVVLISSDGLEETEIAYGSHPVWSPDGTKIAFSGGGDPPGHSGSTEIYVMNHDGTQTYKVGQYSWSDIMNCGNAVWSWSKDGRLLAYADLIPGKIHVTTSSGGHEAVYVVDGCDPAWSPATDEIAFVVNESTSLGIYIGNPLSGGFARRLTSGDFPSWSPDAGQIAFYRTDGVASVNLYVIDSDGTNERLVANLGPFMSYVEHAPRWSPDGTHLMAPRNTQLADLTWRHDTLVASTDDPQITEIPLSRAPSWSPDGKLIAYSTWDEKGQLTHVIPAAGGEPLLVTHGYGPAWTPDGKVIALTRQPN